MKNSILLLTALIGHQYIITAEVIESCDSKIYCQGPLLDLVQKAEVYNDSKTFVDLVQKNSPEITLENFEALLDTNSNPTKEQIEAFIQQNFDSESELIPWTPTDYNENPAFLNQISDNAVRTFAQQLIQIWPVLARKVNSSVSEHPDRHSLISLPEGFIIPGGRFKEVYYWDTYWIIKGLLISGMDKTARGMLDNFVSLIKRLGFVPNGSRVYYLNRSQPPLLTAMVGLYIDSTNNKTWLKENIDALEQELNWWLENRTVTVVKDGIPFRLAQYAVESGTPRPESYSEDLATCSTFQNEQKETCYKNIKSGAESGWDFSSRWLVGSDGSIVSDLESIDVLSIVPVDLNAYLCGAFGQISRFYKLLGNSKKSFEWLQVQEQWKIAILRVLYDFRDGIWYDWDNTIGKPRRGFYPSNFAPLATVAFNPLLMGYFGKRAIDYLEANEIETDYAGGIPTSLLNSGQQWDLPNAWPPLQDIIVTGLHNTNSSRGIQKARLFAQRSLTAFMNGFKNSTEMFEKYDALVSGQYGGGGEYTVQSGFGWTNGVALSFIKYLFL